MPKERLFTRDFILVSIANLFQGMSFFLFIHLPRFLAEMGADEVLIGVLIGVTALASIAIRPLVGRIMDTRGRRPVILAGGAVPGRLASLLNEDIGAARAVSEAALAARPSWLRLRDRAAAMLLDLV